MAKPATANMNRSFLMARVLPYLCFRLSARSRTTPIDTGVDAKGLVESSVEVVNSALQFVAHKPVAFASNTGGQKRYASVEPQCLRVARPASGGGAIICYVHPARQPTRGGHRAHCAHRCHYHVSPSAGGRAQD